MYNAKTSNNRNLYAGLHLAKSVANSASELLLPVFVVKMESWNILFVNIMAVAILTSACSSIHYLLGNKIVIHMI